MGARIKNEVGNLPRLCEISDIQNEECKCPISIREEEGRFSFSL